MNEPPASAPPSPVHAFTRSPPARQGGWVGLVVLLLAVLIVAFLAKDALVKYLGPAATPPRSAAPAQAGAAAGAPAAAAPMDRARGLQDMMQKESEKRGGD
ncbi:MAG: hypothetical protein U1F41_08875 [Burkholderiales bacterium]